MIWHELTFRNHESVTLWDGSNVEKRKAGVCAGQLQVVMIWRVTHENSVSTSLKLGISPLMILQKIQLARCLRHALLNGVVNVLKSVDKLYGGGHVGDENKKWWYRVLHIILPRNCVCSRLLCAWMWQCHVASLWLQQSTMAPPVSLELHERIVVWRYELKMPIDTIVLLSGCSKCTVNNVLSTYHDYNQVVNPLVQPWGHPCILDRSDLNFINSILAAEPALYLDEIQEKLHVFQDVEVLISMILRTLSWLDHTHKGIVKEALKCNKLLRATWQIDMAQYDPQQLIFIDEAGVDDHTNIWRKGWVLRPNFMKLKFVNSSPSTRSSVTKCWGTSSTTLVELEWLCVIRRYITQGLWVIEGSSVIRRTREHL